MVRTRIKHVILKYKYQPVVCALLFTGVSSANGFLLVKHSQSREVPPCPASTTKLWEGYSLLNTEGNERSFHQNLGELL